MCDKCREVNKPAFREYLKLSNRDRSRSYDLDMYRLECKYCRSTFEEEEKYYKINKIMHWVVYYFIMIVNIVLLYSDIVENLINKMMFGFESKFLRLFLGLVYLSLILVFGSLLFRFVTWMVYKFTRFRVVIDREVVKGGEQDV